ncbi:MAG TPA: RsmE family RNA methyltransferase [Bacteroidota bacterium]|nr:RsmE family RNA methyltransferase [Bacteroidota bacterium]
MDVFYVSEDDIHDSTILIRGDELKHLSRVLRKKVGERIFVTDGNDRMYEAAIRSINYDEAECEILERKHRVNEPKVEVTLAVSLLKNPARLDFLVEKATELGVRAIVPMLCDRTIPRHEKHERLERIALAAMKQCGRSFVPRIFMLSSFESIVHHANEYHLRLIPHEKIEQSQYIGAVMQHHPEAKSALLLIGPEGGFTEDELELASAEGCIPISLGPRRLRSETAALVAVSSVVGGW